MANRQKEQMTRLGLLSLTPFILAAVALWLSPWLLPQYIALDFHQLALIYGGAMVAYLAGAGAGVTLSPAVKQYESFLPGQLITLLAVAAIIPSGVFFFSLDAAWRHLIILALLIYLLMRDLQAASAGVLPRWYAQLRLRLTLWAGLAIALIIARLFVWGFY